MAIAEARRVREGRWQAVGRRRSRQDGGRHGASYGAWGAVYTTGYSEVVTVVYTSVWAELITY